MFTEHEIAAMVELPAINQAVFEARKAFTQKEAKYMEISEHDFLSLIMMTPPVGISLADGSIGFMEEMALNKKARKMSKGGFILSKDPVSDAMRFLIKNFSHWEVPFYDIIRLCMEQTFSLEEVNQKQKAIVQDNAYSFSLACMQMPYMFIKFMSAVFIKGESDIITEKKVSKVEMEKIKFIAEKLGLAEGTFFQLLLSTFKIK